MLDNNQNVKAKILSDSAVVDHLFMSKSDGEISAYSLSFPVPKHHTRATMITETFFAVSDCTEGEFPLDSYFFVDSSLKMTFIDDYLGERAHYVDAAEHTLKEVSWLDSFIVNQIPKTFGTIVGIGGGVLLNAAAYIAEERKLDFIAVPTTVVAASDSSIGGLVRINKAMNKGYKKSFYKSVYEPSKIMLDPRFLANLSAQQVGLGLAEVVKHAVYQSPALLEYLANSAFDPFDNPNVLLKAICWTLTLKKVAIVNDPDSESFGGEILRGGHQLAHEIEEESHFRVPHTQAVAIGIYQDALRYPVKLKLLDLIYRKLGLPRSLKDIRV